MATFDEHGKLNGKVPVLNDVLAYVHSKLKLCEMYRVIDIISSYYSIEELKEARDVAYSLEDPNGNLPRLRSKAESDVAYCIVAHLYNKLKVFESSFLAFELNHLHCVDVIDNNEVEMFLEQHKIQNTQSSCPH